MSGSQSTAVVSAGWEVGGSVFSSITLLRELISKASQDNVHPQAILAAEALGASMLFANQRIGEAKEAVTVNRNYRLQETRIAIGLHYGNTLRAIQVSTPLLKFFTFVSALKLVYVNDELAELLYELVSATGLIEKIPVFPKQFQDVLEQITGHADKFAPKDLMHEIASKVAIYNPKPTIYDRPDSSDIAQLFVALFDALRDVEISEIQLKGHLNGVWMATTILWWLSDQAYLVVNDTVLWGEPGRRVSIFLGVQDVKPWTLQTWKKTSEAKQLLCFGQTWWSHLPRIRRLPLAVQVDVLQTIHMEVKKASAETITRWTETVGILATSLVFILLHRGKLRIGDISVSLTDLVDEEWGASLDSVLIKYGFPHCRVDTDLVNKIFDLLDSTSLEEQQTDGEPQQVDCGELEELFVVYVVSQYSDGSSASILRPAYGIAIDAILTCTTNVIDERFTEGVGQGRDEKANIGWIVDLIYQGLDIDEFRAQAFQKCLGGEQALYSKSLAFTRNGLVISMDMLREISTDPRKALAMELDYGTIKLNDAPFASIHEDQRTVSPSFYSSHHIEAAELLRRSIQGLSLSSPIPSTGYALEQHVSFSGDKLILKQYLVEPGTRVKSEPFSVQWTDAIKGCARATVFRNLVSSKVHSELASILRLDGQVSWGSVDGLVGGAADRLIVDTHGNELVKAFSIGIHSLDEGRKIFNYSFSSRSLLPMLHAAFKTDRWVVFL